MNPWTMLEKATDFHGEFCVGLALGTRIAVTGLCELGISDPSKTRDLVVYVEIDRCLADAIQAICKCTLGKRRLKYVDYGKFAATFVDMSANRAVRISVKEEARELALKSNGKQSLSDNERPLTRKEERERLKDGYMKMTEKDLLKIETVDLDIPTLDLPGFPQRKAMCCSCGERILDGREKLVNGKILCRPCVEGAYYKPKKTKTKRSV